MIHSRYRTFSLIAILAFGLLACSGNDAKKPASQVAAKVNGQEISVHQLNFALARSGISATPEQATQLRQEALNRLVDRQMVVAEAMAKKLDRSPNVLMALESARQEILANAYFEQMGTSQAQPSQEEAKKYYAEHRELFAERRIFNIQELTLQGNDQGIAEQLKSMALAGKSINEIAEWLKKKEIKFATGAAVRPAEQLPLELLPRLHALKEGQGMVMQGPLSTTVMRLAGVREAPVSEEEALPSIVKFLANQRLKESMTQEMKKLREKAKIEYVGEFADAAKSAAADVPKETAEKKTPATPSPTDSVIEKGAAGLK